MKSKIILIITILLTAVLFNACKKGDSLPTGPVSTEDYFPTANGNYYKYNIERTDSNGTHTTGTRSSSYNGMQLVGSTNYQVQVDSITIAGFTSTGYSYFRKSDTGVFYFLDTTGLSAAVPDSLLQYIHLDGELNLLSTPFYSGKYWPVFKMNLAYGIITVTVADVSAYYQGTENLAINLNGANVNTEAAKIKYVLKLQIPSPTAQNPFNVISKEFSAYMWLIHDIGIVKMQGNGTILGAFGGQGVDFADTTTVISQTLTSYSLK